MNMLLLIAMLYGLLAFDTWATYLAARWFGMRATEVRIGSGPTLRRFVARSGTPVALALFPGGRLRIAGWTRQPDDESTYVGEYGRRGLGARAATALVGPIALFVVSVLANVGYELATPHEELAVPLSVAAVNDGSAAAIAGVRQADELLSLGGRRVTSLETLLSAAGACHGCELVVQRGGQRVALTVEPQPSFPGSSQRVLGVVLGRRRLEHGWAEAIQRGTAGTLGSASAQVRGALGIPTPNVGPPGIPPSLSDIVRPNPWRALGMLSLVALMLAMFNLIPGPALAGGRLVALVLEAFMGHQLSARAERRVLWGVFVVIVVPVIAWLSCG